MAITKNFIQLTPDSGDSYVPEIKLLSKTEFTAYVIDGAFTTGMCSPSMSGSNFEEMKNLAFTQEFKDKSTPIFYFSQSKTFCINLVPAYFAACFSSPSAAIGLFQPTVVELHKTTGTSVVGELFYEGNKIYLSLPSMTRGSSNASTHIKNGSTVIARPSDYGYDIDSKTATKNISISSSGWRFGHNSAKPIIMNVTNEYAFKYSTEYDKLSAVSLNSLTDEDSETAVVFNSQTNSGFSSLIGRGSTGSTAKVPNQSWISYASSISSKLNIPNSAFNSPVGASSFLISKLLTPQVISAAKASYLCNTINPYGVGEIFTVDINKQTVSAAGSSYTAIGESKKINNTTIESGSLYNSGIRVVANKDSLSGKTSIIKNNHGDGITVSSESACYKVATAASYSVLRSDDATDTQDDQSYVYCFQAATKKLIHVGSLQCVTDKNKQALSDSYATGVMVLLEKLASSRSSSSFKIYVLYDDSSIAISSYNITLSGSRSGRNACCPMKISADGKNVVAHRPYLSKSYTGSPSIQYMGIVGGLPADDAFIVPENSGTKKIEAVGVVYESGSVDQSYYYPYGGVSNGTFLILEPKV